MSSRQPILLLVAAAVAGAALPPAAAQSYPARRVTNGCFVTANSFTANNKVTSLSVIQTGDVHVLVQGDNVLRRYSASGTLGYSVTMAAGPTDVAAATTGDAWVVTRTGNTLQRVTFAGTIGGTFGAAVAGTDPVAVAAITAGGGGIADAWIVNGSAQQVRRVAFTGVLSWSRSVAGTPVDVCAHPTADSWVVMRSPNQLQRFAANGTPGAVVALAGVPVAVDVDAAGNVAVVTTAPNELRSYSANATLRFTVPLPAAPAGVAIDPSGNPAVTLPSLGDLRRYSFANGSQVCSVQLLHQPGAMDVNPGNGDFWVASEPPPNPLPQLASLAPSNALAGGPQFTLTLDGSGFINGSIARWNGADLPTSFGGATRLTATVAAARIAARGTASVTVFNPPPGGGTSNPLLFTIGQTRAAVTAYGTGCAGTNGVPLLAASGLPRLGSSYRLDLTSARALTSAVFFVGLSRTTWLGLQLPFSMAIFGAPNCTLLASGEVTFSLGTSGAGAASLQVNVPNDTSLIDLRLFHQVLVADPAANALQLAFTRALDALIGDL
jgi:hypothetical protein